VQTLYVARRQERASDQAKRIKNPTCFFTARNKLTSMETVLISAFTSCQSHG
jgi:hypothetical protein